MKKIIVMIMTFVLVLSLIACQDDTIIQDDSPITFSVSLGNNQAYYEKLKEAIKEDLGIEVKFIYQNAIDTTNAVRLELKNNDLAADIMVTASKTDNDYLASSCIDLMSYTHLSDLFTSQKINDYLNSDGSLYQLPFTSRLIGITYNKTLLDEMGWTEPNDYDDLLDLKKKCDEKGILFAVSAGAATGHGFNYLFHMMGAEWLSTLEGTEWFNDFLSGKQDITEFKKHASYFEDFVNNGLFGSYHDSDWNASSEFCSRRALFYFDLTNSIYSYEGNVVNQNGEVIGTTKDEYKTIPWISKDGSNNCYTYYDNMFLMLNKKLEGENQVNRLKKCIQILEYMTTEKATSIFKELNKDGYVAVKDFSMDEDRTYGAYIDKINSGYLMPWYYSYFDNDSIMEVGALVNQMISEGTVTLEDCLNKLQDCRNNNLANIENHICTMDETFNYQDVAKINCIGALTAFNNALKENKIDEHVSAVLVPYVNDVSDFESFSQTATISTKAYKGEFVENDLLTIIPAKGQSFVGLKLTGKELKEIIINGLNDGTKNYAYMVLRTETIEDSKTYLVIASLKSLNAETLTTLTKENKILLQKGSNFTVTIKDGVKEFLLSHDHLTSDLINQYFG